MRTGQIVITTQNHGFALDPTSLGIGWAPLDAAFTPAVPGLCEAAPLATDAPDDASQAWVASDAAPAAATMADKLPKEPLLGYSPAGFGALEVTYLSLNDGTVEGLRFRDYPALSVQFHPEAAPGPHDASSFFEQFLSMVKDHA
ncbi:MAG: hypothetical protein JXC32_15680 [Anaerolineae bacterium]|nr:hypothetical protein [Anaerolineae bacterium]